MGNNGRWECRVLKEVMEEEEEREEVRAKGEEKARSWMSPLQAWWSYAPAVDMRAQGGPGIANPELGGRLQ